MQLFCVRTKSRSHRRSRSTRDSRTSSSLIHIEARPKRLPTETPLDLCIMGHLNTCTGFSGSGPEHRSCSYSHLLGSPTRSASRDRGLDFDPGNYGTPPQNNSPQSPQIRQVYVHPYSTYHYRFPVVYHCTTSHGHRLTASPTYYTAIVPESATVRDIEAELIIRQGQIGMARLLATEHLVCMNTFHCIRTLHDASLQLEVWDVADVALNPLN